MNSTNSRIKFFIGIVYFVKDFVIVRRALCASSCTLGPSPLNLVISTPLNEVSLHEMKAGEIPIAIGTVQLETPCNFEMKQNRQLYSPDGNRDLALLSLYAEGFYWPGSK